MITRQVTYWIMNIDSIDIIDSQTEKGRCSPNNSIKFETETIKASFCDYSDAFILLTGDIKVAADDDTDVAFKNYASFSKCKTEINYVFVDEANHIYVAMPMYNLIEYSDNYADTPGSLRQFKREEVRDSNANLTVDISELFTYKASLLGKTTHVVDNTNRSAKSTKLVVPLKYLSDFLTSLEMPLINCEIHLELNCIEDCILSSA